MNFVEVQFNLIVTIHMPSWQNKHDTCIVRILYDKLGIIVIFCLGEP